MYASQMKYNMASFGPASADEHAAANGAVTGVDAHVGSINPENPMLWLFGIGALTIGLVGVSTHLRVGNVRVGADAGKP